MKEINKKNIKRGLMFLGLLMIFVVFFFTLFYFCNPLSDFCKPFFKVIPFPIAKIDNKIITTRDLLEDMQSLEKFYNNQNFSDLGLRIDFETIEGKDRLKVKEKEVFNKIIENELVEKISNSKGIVITDKQAEQEIVTKAQETGNTENLALNLRKLYNWSLLDFRNKVIIPRLYLRELIDYYEKQFEENSPLKKTINKAYNELQNGISFDEVTKKYSEGETAKIGGELGWFRKEYLSDVIAEKAYSMQPGEFSEIITTPLGSHIIYLEEVQEKEGIKQVKLKQIFTKEGSFLDWLDNEKRNFSVKLLTKDYYWDNTTLKVKFSDQKLEEKEDYIRNNSIGDPSF